MKALGSTGKRVRVKAALTSDGELLLLFEKIKPMTKATEDEDSYVWKIAGYIKLQSAM